MAVFSLPVAILVAVGFYTAHIPSQIDTAQSSTERCRLAGRPHGEEPYLSVISPGEILKGITILPTSKRRAQLEQWLEEALRPWFGDRILPSQ